MKLSLSEKTLLFGHYLLNRVKAANVEIIMQSIDGNTGCVNGPANVVQLPIEDCKLILKPLNTVTKRDAMKCAELANMPLSMVKNWEVRTNVYDEAIFHFPGSDETPANYSRCILFNEKTISWQMADYLRKMGYRIGVPDDCCIIECVEKTVQI